MNCSRGMFHPRGFIVFPHFSAHFITSRLRIALCFCRIRIDFSQSRFGNVVPVYWWTRSFTCLNLFGRGIFQEVDGNAFTAIFSADYATFKSGSIWPAPNTKRVFWRASKVQASIISKVTMTRSLFRFVSDMVEGRVRCLRRISTVCPLRHHRRSGYFSTSCDNCR